MRAFETYMKQMYALTAADEARFMNRGIHQLQEQEKHFLNLQDETNECASFMAWAAKSHHVRKVTEKMFLPSFVGFEVNVLDFSPRGAGGDDMVYLMNPDVWERVTRGCAIVEFKHTASGNVYMIWGVRANRKFSGHEDEETEDNSHYTVNVMQNDGVTPLPVTEIVATVKENGSVVHVACRDVKLPELPNTIRVLIAGSKKVHMAVEWTEDFAKLAQSLQKRDGKGGQQRQKAAAEEADETEDPADRTALASEMLRTVHQYLISPAAKLKAPAEMVSLAFPPEWTNMPLVDWVARYRLVLNSEFLVPEGSGPIDNRTVHGLNQPTPFFFSMAFNVLTPVRELGTTLCVCPVFGLLTMRALGWRITNFFVSSADKKDRIVADIASLPDIEGAVLYHMNERGAVALEKSKAAGYVVARSVREKSKRSIGGSAKNPGIVGDAADLMTALITVMAPFPALSPQLQAKLQSSGGGKKGGARRASAADEIGDKICVPVPTVLEAVGQELTRLGGSSVGGLVADAFPAYRFPGSEAANNAAPAAAAPELVRAVSDGLPASPALSRTESNMASSVTIGTLSPQQMIDVCKSQLLSKEKLFNAYAPRAKPVVWVLPASAEDAARKALQAALENAFSQRFRTNTKAFQTAVFQRIESIDHVPISNPDRREYVAIACSFAASVVAQFFTLRLLRSADFIEHYSHFWADHFYAWKAAAQRGEVSVASGLEKAGFAHFEGVCKPAKRSSAPFMRARKAKGKAKPADVLVTPAQSAPASAAAGVESAAARSFASAAASSGGNNNRGRNPSRGGQQQQQQQQQQQRRMVSSQSQSQLSSTSAAFSSSSAFSDKPAAAPELAAAGSAPHSSSPSLSSPSSYSGVAASSSQASSSQAQTVNGANNAISLSSAAVPAASAQNGGQRKNRRRGGGGGGGNNGGEQPFPSRRGPGGNLSTPSPPSAGAGSASTPPSAAAAAAAPGSARGGQKNNQRVIVVQSNGAPVPPRS